LEKPSSVFQSCSRHAKWRDQLCEYRLPDSGGHDLMRATTAMRIFQSTWFTKWRFAQ
jgi:hypothetical protein